MNYRSLHALWLCAVMAMPAQAAGLAISNAWFRALPNNLPAAGYFTLKNAGAKAVSLTGADSSACGMLMLHKTEHAGGMNHMSMVDSVDVPAGGTLSFAPGGYHLMCMDPAATMKPGATVSVTLKFADGTTLQTGFPVKAATGK
jgi:periplasmic copper chaperone A